MLFLILFFFHFSYINISGVDFLKFMENGDLEGAHAAGKK